MDLEKLRSVVRDCLGKHLYSSAVFFADKLVTISRSNPADVYLLGQAYYLGRHYRQALHLLRREGLLTANLRFQYLAGKCLEAVKDWEECLAMVGEDDEGAAADAPDDDLTADMAADVAAVAAEASGEGREISVRSAIYLLRGRAYEALENRVKALHWYKAALREDPFCYEAFEHLIDHHMLTTAEEEELLGSLRFDGDDRWLGLLYSCRGKKYGRKGSIESKLQQLEGGGGSGGDSAAWQAEGGGAAPPSLAGNADVAACRADLEYECGAYQAAYDITKKLLEADPFCQVALPVHLAAALELRKKNELFLRAHQLVEQYPQKAIGWFAVGCYYFCIDQFDQARRFFCKATQADGHFAPAWLGFGNAYAAQDESDQATTAYRTASRLFAGLHLPLLCIGMEYQETNNLNLAEEFLREAERICPSDPLVHNEKGVLAFCNESYGEAARSFEAALALAPAPLGGAWEPTIVNLGHAYRKQGYMADALAMYERALALNPQEASTHVALGFTHHMQGDVTLAITYYHKALGLRPRDTVVADLLTEALSEECHRFSASLAQPPPAAPLRGVPLPRAAARAWRTGT